MSASEVHPDACSLYWIEDGEATCVGQDDMSPKDLHAELLRLILDKGQKGQKAQEAAYRVSRGDKVNQFDQISDITIPPGTSIAIVRTFNRWGQYIKNTIPRERDIPTFRKAGTPQQSAIDLRPGRDRPNPCLIDKISIEGNPAMPSLSVNRGTMIGAFQNVQSLSSSHPHRGSDHILGITIRSLPADDEVPAFLRSTHHEATWEELEMHWRNKSRYQWGRRDHSEFSGGAGVSTSAAAAATEESQRS